MPFRRPLVLETLLCKIDIRALGPWHITGHHLTTEGKKTMDKVKQIIGSFGKYILMGIIALLSFGSGSVTDLGQAFQIAFDKDKALAQAAVIINETPKEEIVQAVQNKGESAAIVEDIKPSELPSEPISSPAP